PGEVAEAEDGVADGNEAVSEERVENLEDEIGDSVGKFAFTAFASSLFLRHPFVCHWTRLDNREQFRDEDVEFVGRAGGEGTVSSLQRRCGGCGGSAFIFSY
ncbi:hypothetical protein JCM11641_003367, partial [Rhodosporidiobolus odoratus]